MRHLLTLFDITADEAREILELASSMKRTFEAGRRDPLFPGRVLALLFEKQSLRTRVSFEAAMTHLGGSALFLGEDVGWGKRESAADFSAVISQYVDVIVCRAKAHKRVEELAQFGSVPIINGLTDIAHPCQALADLLTLSEVAGGVQGKKLAYVGDANNVARSLVTLCAMLNTRFAIAAPEGYQFDKAFIDKVREKYPRAEIQQTTDPVEAVAGADAVYTDVWASMGQEAEQEVRAKALSPYQVNGALLKHAAPTACFLHCLPARRGEEVTDEVMDGPQSAVVRQAANRMHAQKGVLAWILRQSNKQVQ